MSALGVLVVLNCGVVQFHQKPIRKIELDGYLKPEDAEQLAAVGEVQDFHMLDVVENKEQNIGFISLVLVCSASKNLWLKRLELRVNGEQTSLLQQSILLPGKNIQDYSALTQSQTLILLVSTSTYDYKVLLYRS